MKRFLFTLGLCLSCFVISQNLHAQGIFSRKPYRSPFERGGDKVVATESKEKKESSVDIYLTPTIGFQHITNDASLFSFGLDTQYIHSSGFTCWFNNTFGVGTAPSFIDIGFYGYSPYEEPSKEIAFVYLMDLLLGYSFSFDKHLIGLGGGLTLGGGLRSNTDEFIAAFGMRFDYAYNLTDKIGIQTSLNNSVGLFTAEYIGNSLTLKLGCLINVK
ncbi:MAG: DUF2715 domain-containing protein [Treponemataceae bacterium]